MKTDVTALIGFIKLAEKLKTELRHSWTSDVKRQESVAEHSWLMALIAMTVFDSVVVDVNRLKVMKMIILHDLAEAITGDIPAFDHSRRKNKHENERIAMHEIIFSLPEKTSAEFMELWDEMEARKTPEALLAQCMDKIEVLIQHIISDISTWDDGDYSLGPYNKDELFDFDPFIREFKDEVNGMFWEKMEMHNKIDRLKAEHIARHKKERE